MSRHPERDMLKSWGGFDTTLKLCKNAHDKSSVKRYRGLLDTLKQTYYDFDSDWRLYKEETVKKSCKTEEAFNAVEETEGNSLPAFKHNDGWSESQLLRYVEMRDLLEDSLDEQTHAQEVLSKAADKSYDADFAIDEVRSDMKSLENSISKLVAEINSYDDETMPVAVVKGFENVIIKLENKIDNELKTKVMSKLATDVECSDPSYSNANLRVRYREFHETCKSMLDSCNMLLVKKTLAATEVKSTDSVAHIETDLADISLSSRPREQVFLEKTKPPRFLGDDIEFPEFKRKWLSQVNKANLPEETELDKLKRFNTQRCKRPDIWCYYIS